MIKEINFNDKLKEMLNQINKGAFLTITDGENTNTMTIGWGNVGIVWGKPIFMVAVRYSRYTYDLIEKAKDFTVSIPLKNNLKKELTYCGTYSGKDVDKFKECNLKLKKGRKVVSPIIEDCELHYECNIVYKQAMEPSTLNEDIKNQYYKNKDYHVLYFGEIVDCYLIE
ncbi:MAG: flavin reductase family protein [Tissierellia bacterium]|nr:flavin reductase family protein [Tissierellia bacterium]